MSAASYKGSHDYCRRRFRERNFTFYFLSYLLSPLERKALGALAAYSDFVQRGFINPSQRSSHVKACEGLMARLYEHRRPEFVFKFELALEQTVTRYNIPQTLLWQMVEGHLFEIYHRQPQNEEELLDLGTHFGGVWGRFVGHILGKSAADIEWSRQVGVAVWLAELAMGAPKLYAPVSWQEIDFVSAENLRGRLTQFAIENLQAQKAKIRGTEERLEGLLKIVIERSLDLVDKTPHKGARSILETTLFEKARLLPKLIKVFA